jgi:hypothetical protein
MKKIYFIAPFCLFIGVAPMVVNAINSQTNSMLFIVNEELTITVDTKDASGKNENGYIQIKVSGGTAPYKISFFSPYALPSHTNGNILTLENIKPGEYLFVIQDSLGKTASQEVKIEKK